MKKKIIHIIGIYALVAVVTAVMFVNYMNSKSYINEDYLDRYHKKRDSESMFPENYEIIEDITYGEQLYGGMRLNDIQSLSEDEDVKLYYKPSQATIHRYNLELPNGMIDLREKIKNSRLKRQIENTAIYKIFKYDDKKIIEVVAYEDHDEYNTEYSKIYDEERRELKEAIEKYNGKRSRKDIKALLEKIMDYCEFHCFEEKSIMPNVRFAIYDNQELVYVHTTSRIFYDCEVVKGEEGYFSSLRSIYNEINPNKKHDISFVYGDDGGIDEVIIEYNLKKFLIFREKY